jgi:hypothetical protein
MKIFDKIGPLCIVLALIAAALVFPLPEKPFEHPMVPTPNYPDRLSIYEKAEIITGTSSSIIRGIAFAESSYKTKVKHRDPLDKGMFGLHEDESYHRERAVKWGEYDAENPQGAALIAGYLYQENLRILKDADLAIAAHYQGPTGVKRNGPALWYIERVRTAP